MRRRAFLAAAAATLAPSVARAQLFPNGQVRQSTIGISVPLSGPLASFGQDIVRGVQAAIDESNRFNAPLQRAFGFRALDDQNSGGIATTNVSIAAADPSIIAMIGNLTAPVTIQALPQYANANFALVVPSVTADSLTAHGFHNIYRLPTKDSSQGILFARSALGRAAHNAIAVAIDGDYGTDVARGFTQQALSDKRAAETITLPNGFDPGTIAESLRKKSPDYIFLCGKLERLGPVADALRTAGYRGDFGASDGFYAQATIDKFAKPLDGALVASPLPPLNRVPSIFQLYNDFSHYVGAITAFSAFGYAAAQLIMFAAQRSNAVTRYSLLNSMQRSGSYNTIVGQYSFDFAGDASIPNVYLYTVGSDGFKFAKAAIATGFVV